MIPHTAAFTTYRTLSQQHLDFAVLVCTAVPALKPELSDVTTPLKHAPDHFKTKLDSKKQLVKYAANYQSELARTNLITLFSYFESYVRAALQEVISFHGGDDDFRKLAMQRASKFSSKHCVRTERATRIRCSESCSSCAADSAFNTK